ncbi:hypothetical protein OSB04_012629 [Centaurea solstitialis]|uniref:Ubiquitin-like domain-containing protein n=1 Tax=Centaurea solstitialis TaxID=347529 RepID=A0AA38TBQ0_9ASTR|nr:hypothetical protein OSB04_012629 [Centaurea solstitialis]
MMELDTDSCFHFFVRLIDSKTLVLRGNPQDEVFSIHENLQSITGIPVSEQRLVYGRTQLQCNRTLSECMITKDAELHLGAVAIQKHGE